jgi:beta-1,4-N-acetylglucosaminyltransferase
MLGMLVFVTVGSTRFDALIHKVLSEPVLSSLRQKGYKTLVVQSGNSEYDVNRKAFSGETLTVEKEKDGVHIEIWQFKPSLLADYERADLVISHAGLRFVSSLVD